MTDTTFWGLISNGTTCRIEFHDFNKFPWQTNWNPVPQPLSGLSYFLVRGSADTFFSWVTTSMLILCAYPSRTVKSIDLEDHNLSSTVGGLKTCKNTFRLKLFKSWVTSFHGLPHSPRCSVGNSPKQDLSGSPMERSSKLVDGAVHAWNDLCYISLCFIGTLEDPHWH